jgi:hypothetical protein
LPHELGKKNSDVWRINFDVIGICYLYRAISVVLTRFNDASGQQPLLDQPSHSPFCHSERGRVGRLGKELDVEAGRDAAYTAALSVLAAAKKHLGSLDRVTRVVRLGVFLATFGDFYDLAGMDEEDAAQASGHLGQAPSLVRPGRAGALPEGRTRRRGARTGSGHFALDTKADEIAAQVRSFMDTRK